MNLKPPALTTAEFYTGLALKVFMGILYGYIFLHYYNGDDTWHIHRQSLNETKTLLHHPSIFFTEQYTPLFAIQEGITIKKFLSVYINDLEYAMLVKTLAIFNLISRGNYYINVLLFNCILIWGHYWLFILFKDLFPGSRKQIYISVFVFLPAVFWLSGIRVDGLLFFFFSLFLLNIYRRKVLLTITGLLGMIILRPQFGLLTLLAAIPFLISVKIKKNHLLLFAGCYIVFIILFFALGIQYFVTDAQQRFFALKGTRFDMQQLQPTIASFILLLPSAFNHVFLRPYPWETGSALQLFYSIEIIIFWVIIVWAIINRKQRINEPIVLMIIFLAISICLLYGYIVPFPGALARYRIIPELLLVTLAASYINYRKI